MDDTTKALVDDRARIVDTLGNLTLITGSLNPSLGQAGWEKKKEKLASSLLALNRMVAKTDDWNEKSIVSRGVRISEVIVARWGYAT